LREIHSYVLEVEDSKQPRDKAVRQSQAKQFYVSPFIDMQTRYHFRLSLPGEQVKVRILQTDEAGPVLAATFSGRRHALTSRSLLATFLGIPLFTFKVVAAIYWQAFRLWLKGAPLVPRAIR
jgi:uncharacterized protein